MNTTQNNGGPAFPQASPEMVITGQSIEETQGMSLRDYFAAHAPITGEWFLSARKQTDDPRVAARALVEWAYVYADAMLAERAKGDAT